jgi:ComF family protein
MSAAKAILPGLKSSLEALLGFFYPEVCHLCQAGRAGVRDAYICPRCAGQVQRLRPPWCETCGRPVAGEVGAAFVCGLCRESETHYRTARSAVAFDGPAREAIHQYKYNRAMWFEPKLAEWLAEAARPELRGGDWSLLVPVPLHPVKQREREFNQAERLAGHLSRATGIPLNAKLVKRVRNTPSQTQLTREARAANMRNAFAVAGGERLAGERIVLVDDVMTTGATVNELARILHRAGAGDICVWTLARGL